MAVPENFNVRIDGEAVMVMIEGNPSMKTRIAHTKNIQKELDLCFKFQKRK